MAPYDSTSTHGKSVLLFGSQALNFDDKTSRVLRSSLVEDSSLSWISDTITDFPELLDLTSKTIPSLASRQNQRILQDLIEWINTGTFGKKNRALPNIILTPLVVAQQLIQYSYFLKVHGSDGPRDAPNKETLGLCTGLLSAAAASSSPNQRQFKRYGAVALRLAMLIGAIVDVQDQSEQSQSFTVSWTKPEIKTKLDDILAHYKKVYISVVLDESKVTLTADKAIVPELQKDMREAGIFLADIALQGRFHSGKHKEVAQALNHLCDSEIALQFPDASRLWIPMRSNTDGKLLSSGYVHHEIIQSMLLQTSNWQSAFNALQPLFNDSTQVIYFGAESNPPHASLKKLGSRYTRAASLAIQAKHDRSLEENGIAVVGMSCKFPGADDVNDFWDLLAKAESQHQEVPKDRVVFETLWREPDPKRTWYGNFIKDHDTFDHKFFKKSPREMSSTDPQHRLMLQASYQAVEQSGYFNHAYQQDMHIGCYVGVGLVDYENNIACAPANAYSATGNLKSFTAGKISHYFGWTGPGLTIDTACSSSAVAIDAACKAILSGECSAALAGGVNAMTSPEWFQNLAGASFLSPTGQCKPFDSKADGYCRGEGVGAVFLKKLSAALEDGDQVLAVIGASSVYQNQNCTAITVPNAISLSGLFGDALKIAGLQPKDITYVEAHGTGTPVGDPAEYDSVRQVLGGPTRSGDALSIGSVKGLIGHLESASGIAALIKVIMMINKASIPKQPSHQMINPSINAVPEDNMEISNSLRTWDPDLKAALINNYGASGSNACMIVSQLPQRISSSSAIKMPASTKYPFWLCGYDDKSLQAWATQLLKLLDTKGTSLDISDLSFQIAQQTNRSLDKALIFNSSSIDDLKQTLGSTINGTSVSTQRPVVLCFGGQISTFIGLDEQVFESVALLRSFLEECDTVCASLGLDSIFPDIFSKSPIEDIVKLQTMLFSMQYSCAKSWLASGVPVKAAIGFSFGELTALCICGILSLRDALYMVSARARLIKRFWSSDSGAMMAIEANVDTVKKILAESSNDAAIACYNGPTSFTLAGTTQAIDAVSEVIKSSTYSSVKSKRLNVTNAFHSTLVDPLVKELAKIGSELEFRDAKIPFYRATEEDFIGEIQGQYVADQMRQPVYFSHVAARLSKLLGPAVWLEAGSNSTITMIARKALGAPASDHFQAVNITSNNSFEMLADATTSLWKEGIPCTFWAHHPMQRNSYKFAFLPPYQFEKSKHWIDLKSPKEAIPATVVQEAPAEQPNSMWSFMGYQDNEKRKARYRVNNASQKFQDYVAGHIIAQAAPLVPSTVQLGVVIDALMNMHESVPGLQPELDGMQNLNPMSIDKTRSVWLDLESKDSERRVWSWKMMSSSSPNASDKLTHVQGKIIMRSQSDAELVDTFDRYERLIKKQRCHQLLQDVDADEVISGKKIYTRFNEIVEYGPHYKGLKKLTGKGDESAGRVVQKAGQEAWFDAHLADSFCQVAGIYVNLMTDRPSTDVYISDKIDRWIRNPSAGSLYKDVETWEAIALHHQPADKKYASDVFVFDSQTGTLMEVIFGIHYYRVPKAALGKALSRLSGGILPPLTTQKTAQEPVVKASEAPITHQTKPPSPPLTPEPDDQPSDVPDVASGTIEVISNLSGIEPEEIKPESDLSELGIDSLMAMELSREIETMFKCTLDTDQFVDLTTFQSLVDFILKTLGFDPSASKSTKKAPASNDPIVERPPTPASSVSSNATIAAASASLAAEVVLNSFAECKQATDDYIIEGGLSGYSADVLPKSLEMCVAYIAEAFEELGCSLARAQAGDKIERIKYLDKHQQFVDWIYDLLERDARVIDKTESGYVRTDIPVPKKSAQALLEEVIAINPVHTADHELTNVTGKRLANCLIGKEEAVQLIFGSPEGREIAGRMYGKSPINLIWIKQMEDFLKNLLSNFKSSKEPIKILEMGAGTGGTTAKMVQLIADLGVPVEYTVTDLSPSLVTGARKRFKGHKFMQFKAMDIEKAPPAELLQTQHIVLATNCVHATHSLEVSTKNIRQLIRPDGFLLMLEMTDPLPWVDLIFGLIEGWWLFNDGRKHALAPPEVWDNKLKSVGFGHVDWTDGNLPEASIQRVIIALASGARYDRVPIPPPKGLEINQTDITNRQSAIDDFVQKYSADFKPPKPASLDGAQKRFTGKVVLITGATGSLGSHLVAKFADDAEVKTVLCLNRKSSSDPQTRQLQALKSRGLSLDTIALEKLEVIETDTSKPLLGLGQEEYQRLVKNVTHIIHNAWPMSITRPVASFTGQFKAMRSLIDLARDACCSRTSGFKFGFQFISSIATVGYYPLSRSSNRAPEEAMAADTVLPTGYGDAKLVCERMLDETLNKHPDLFTSMVVRIGQIAGSDGTGYWNPVEHFSFIVKSSHTLKAFPDLPGDLSWCPVNVVADTLADLLANETCHRIYHIENPTRQPWTGMSAMLAKALDAQIIPLTHWMSRVRNFPGSMETDNPARKLIDFLEDHFARMDCGGLILDTTKSKQHSKSLREQGAIGEVQVRRYVESWHSMGFF